LLPAVEPKRAAVLGFPVSHSLSPRLHNYWLKRHNIAGSYEAIAVRPEELKHMLRVLSGKGFAGVNLTIPHKERALEMVDEADDIARRIGAVNTIVMKEGKLFGTNTDAYGFMANLKAEMDDCPAGNAMLLGAGGAARAVCEGLREAGWQIRLAARTREKAQAIAENNPAIRILDWKNIQDAMHEATLLVNTTPLGMKGQKPLDITLEALPCTAWVCDIVYAPEKTEALKKYSDPTITDLLARAMDRGLPVVSGLGMLLYQAQPAFEMWFGVRPQVTDELYNYMLEAL
jgi:shikimate dehydrogenase